MVDDIVLTEEEQVEQTKKWLKKNIPSIFIGLALGVALVYGYTYYQDSRTTAASQASALFEKIIAAEEPYKMAAENVETFKSEYAFTPYAAKIALLYAKGLLEEGKIDPALTELEWAEDNAKEELIEQLAKLRQAEVLLSENKLTEASKLVSGKSVPGFESNYAEIKGDIAAAQNDYRSALEHYKLALESGNINPGYVTYLQLKINKMNSLLKTKS